VARTAFDQRLATLAILCLALLGGARGVAGEYKLRVGESVVDVSVTGTPNVSEESLRKWIDDSARAVAAYMGRFPVPYVRLRVRTGGSGGVGYGTTYGGATPSIRISVGRGATEQDLRSDWVLTHEMVHLGFPDLTSDDSWAEEGLATYVEPLARTRVGNVSESEMWAGLMAGIPQGSPGRGDRGLHGTSEWGRIYWGGALFWLLADVGIREETAGRLGLPDALAAILDAGGDIRAQWGLERTLAIADRALGLTVLSDLYDRLGAAPGAVDLTDLWRRLGVRRSRGRVAYDDAAPLAGVRRAITAPAEARDNDIIAR
jgi:hypothetical protein